MSRRSAATALVGLCVGVMLPASVPARAGAPAGTAAIDETTATAALATCLIAEGTVLELAIVDSLSSARVQRGDRFALTLAQPLPGERGDLLPASVPGVGEVVHAERSRGGGKAGELLLAARYLDYRGVHITLRGFKLGGSGRDRTAAALGASFAAGPFAMFVKGNEIELPAGTRAHARTAQAVQLPADSTARPSCTGAPAPAAASAAPARAPAPASMPAPTDVPNHPTE